ncbi:MAG: helix-turn-helix domain-containing protein [Acidimicrobiales bacterium]
MSEHLAVVGVGRRPNPVVSPVGRRDFVEALARGLDVITAFGPTRLSMTVSDVATATGLARPTARRLLLTLEALGHVRSVDGQYSLTTKVLELGTSVIAAQGLWDIARPHMVDLVGQTGESSSMAQLDGSDIVYTARVPVPKIIALAVTIGARFPAPATSMGRVLLAERSADELDQLLAEPSLSGVRPRRAGSACARRFPGRDPLPRVGTVRRDPVARCAFGGGTGARRRRSGHRGHERHGACRGNVDRDPHQRLPPLLLDTAANVSAEWSNLSRLPIAEAPSA